MKNRADITLCVENTGNYTFKYWIRNDQLIGKWESKNITLKDYGTQYKIELPFYEYDKLEEFKNMKTMQFWFWFRKDSGDDLYFDGFKFKQVGPFCLPKGDWAELRLSCATPFLKVEKGRKTSW